jgi:hypothetical protein
VRANKGFGGIYLLHPQGRKVIQVKNKLAACFMLVSSFDSFFDPEDGGDIFLQNVGPSSN